MQTITKALGLAAVCAACCALPVAGTLLAGAAAATLASPLSPLVIGMTALALPLAVLGVLRRRNPASSTLMLAESSSCGCDGGSCKPIKQSAPIACTLDGEDFKSRTAWIRDLARRSLRSARRSPLTLHLVYDAEAASDVSTLVRKETECCAFLSFESYQDPAGIHLVITAPDEARDAADVLFDHFAPELAASIQKETV